MSGEIQSESITVAPTGATVHRPRLQFLREHGRKGVAALFWLALLAGYTLAVRRTGLTPVALALWVRDLLAETAWGPLIYILLYTLRPLIFFPATLTTGIAGYLYGPLWGTVYTTVGANLSATVAYLVGRFFGADLLPDDPEDPGRIARYADALRRNGFEAVLIMRLIYLPYDLVNYLAGFVRVPWPHFALATLLGILPGSLTFVLLGSAFQASTTTQRVLLALFSLITLVIGLGISRFLRRRGLAA